MHEIRLVGRGGQGVVTAGELLGKAAVCEGRFAQAIPTFGPERRGALSMCTLRVDDREIQHKYGSTRPTVLLVLDPTIWHAANVVAGLVEGGTLIFNSRRAPEELDGVLRTGPHPTRLALARYQLFAVDATRIAMDVLGRPITNTAAMGALAGATGLLEMTSIEAVLRERFNGKAAGNIEAAWAAYRGLKKLGG